jgi:hypothetical protein
MAASRVSVFGLVGVREVRLMCADMLRAFQVGKALTSDV